MNQLQTKVDSQIFKEIDGYSYKVNECGVVVSIGGHIKKTQTKSDGYQYVTLFKDGKGSPKYIHRLVAAAFIPNPEDKPCVNHKDFNRTNNHVSNLEWVTYKENMQHNVLNSTRHGHLISGFEESVLLLRSKNISATKIALETNATEYSVIDILKKHNLSGKIYAAKGYSFDKVRNKYRVSFFINGKHMFIGRFNTEDEAIIARQNTIKKYGTKQTSNAI